MQTPNVFVARTFSKAYGMAGLRIGYAIGQAATIKPLAQLKMPYNVSVFGVAAALAALADPKHIEAERARNAEVRAFTVKALDELGCKSSDSQGNFFFVETGRPADAFRDACAAQGIMVGAAVPAAREDPRAHLARHHGRNEEGDRGVPQRAPAGDDDRRQVTPRITRTTRIGRRQAWRSRDADSFRQRASDRQRR